MALLENVFAAQVYRILLKKFQMMPALVSKDINGIPKQKIVIAIPHLLLFSFTMGTALIVNIWLDPTVALLIIMHALAYSAMLGTQEKYSANVIGNQIS